MSRKEIIAREARTRRVVVAASILPLPLLVGAAFAQSSAGSGELAPESLRLANEHSASLLIGSVLGALSFILLIVPLTYLFRAAQARNERMLGGLIAMCVLGPFLLGIQGVMVAVGRVDVAEKFVGQESGVGDIFSLSSNLLEDNGLISASYVVSSIGVIGMIFAMVYTCLWAYRSGLLTRTHGTLGMALGVAFILPPLTPVAVPALLVWFAYFGVLIQGRTSRGRPPAWDAGEAVPWPAPGQEDAAPRPVADDDVIEGDALEIPGVGENPNAARRDRAKKRKRKRRR